jgi:hypothetical protein
MARTPAQAADQSGTEIEEDDCRGVNAKTGAERSSGWPRPGVTRRCFVNSFANVGT